MHQGNGITQLNKYYLFKCQEQTHFTILCTIAALNAAYADPANGARQEGYLIFLVDEDSKCIC